MRHDPMVVDAAVGVGPAAGVLIVGYGNRLRSDDGVGPVVAERLMADPRLARAEIRAVHQLTPELALDASRVEVLVLIDAAEGVAPGDVVVRELEGQAEAGPPLTHHVDPASLVALAAELWGTAPRTLLVGVGPGSLDLGDALTPLVEAAVPRAAQAVVDALARVGER